MEIKFENVYYLKMGKEGIWEKDLNNGNRARIGWSNISVQDIKKNNWGKIKNEIEEGFKKRNKKNGATQDYNALKTFCKATDKDIFITFSNGMLYWCIPDNNEMQEDIVSKYRTLKNNWSNEDIKGQKLRINSISGRITKTQGYRATLCKIRESSALYRIINGKVNPIVNLINKKNEEIKSLLVKAFEDLYWKDTEILTDLIFNQSGWQRVSLVGENMKYIDIELENTITKERYQVQVKAKANKVDFEKYAKKFSDMDYDKLFFVTFNHDRTLDNYINSYDNVNLLKGIDLADLVIRLGLTNWVLDKIA